MKTIKDLFICNYRIVKHDGAFLGAGRDDMPSWFTLEKAREIVDYSKGEKIVQHDGMNIIWEVL
jgi:hypothetical protein